MRINIRLYSCYPCNIIFHFQPQLCKKILFQGGIDLTLVGPTDIGNSEKSAKTTTKTAAKEPAGVPGGPDWPPQAQAGSE